MEAQLFGQILRIVAKTIYLLCGPAVRNEIEQDKRRRHEALEGTRTGLLHSSLDSGGLVVPFVHIVQHGVIGRTVLSSGPVPLVAEFEELQLRTDRCACCNGSFLELLNGVILVHVQAVEELDVAQGMVGLEVCRAIHDCLWLVVVWIIKDELHTLLLVGVVVGMISAD